MSNKTNFFFQKGKISYLLDAGAGSSAKGVTSSFIIDNQDIKPFLCTTNSPNASHTVMTKNGFSIVYKVLSSGSHLLDKFSVVYIGQGAVIDPKQLLKEMKICGLTEDRVRIHPLVGIVQEIDERYEKGEVEFDGKELNDDDESKGVGTIKTGTTASGSGSVRARKVLRRNTACYAKHVDILKNMICENMTQEILSRLEKGESGFHDMCQGFQLSYGHERFAPHTTSRNVTIAAGLDDMMLPPIVVGNICLNLRTFPIRIHSKKYISRSESIDSFSFEKTGGDENNLPIKYSNKRLYLIDKNDTDQTFYITSCAGVHLTWDEVQNNVIPYDTIDSYSGDFYPDQKELTWEELTQISGSETPILETTTLTKLPRRVATFSQMNLEEAIAYNMVEGKIFVSINFANYVDAQMHGQNESISEKFMLWLGNNIDPVTTKHTNVKLSFIGTSPYTEDTITIEQNK